MDIQHGGRVTLRLSSLSEAVAEYEAELLTPDARFEGRALVALPSGAVEVSAPGESPPAWLVDLARTTVRAAFRTARASGTWPRRLSRWRGGPGEEEP